MGKGHEFRGIGGEGSGIGGLRMRRGLRNGEAGLLSGGRQGEVPQASVGRTGASDDGTAVEGDGDGLCIKGGDAAGIAELANRDQGSRGEIGEDVGCACSKWEIGKIEFGRVAGMDDAAVRESDGYAVGGRLDVDERGVYGRKVARAAGVVDVGG